MIKAIAMGLLFSVVCVSGFAQQRVSGYTKSNGTYVSGYTRSSADSLRTNNYSYQGNRNPYTGSIGTKSYSPAYKSYRSGY